MLPGEGNLAQRQRAGKRVSNNWRTGGWGASGSQGWEEGVKESGLVPPALLSPNLGGEDSLPWLGTLWSRPPPRPPPERPETGASRTPLLAHSWGKRERTLPFPCWRSLSPRSLSLDRPLLPSLSTDSLRVLCLLPPALKRSPLSDAPNLALLLDGRTVAASAGSVPSGLRLQPTPASSLATTRAPWTFDPRR